MLKKSNAFKFLIAVFMVVGFTMSSAAMDFGSVTLRVGSKGEYVKTLQTLVGAVPDGNFGPMTKAKVATWQSTCGGLTVDGVFGPKSMAKANSSCGGVITTGGDLCPNGKTLASNCMVLPGGTAPTETLCPNGMTLGSNCMTSPVGVVGGAGNISSMITLGSPSSVVASEGDVAKSVLGVEIKADSGSALNISNFAVKLSKTAGNGSTWISRYLNKVSIMQGSTVIGSISASQLSQNGNDYVANIPVTGAMIAANARGQYYLAVDVNSNIDSNDSGSTITATITSVRYSDGTNVVLSMTATNNQAFTVQKLSSNANVKMQISEDASNPRARTVTANYTTTSTDVSLLKFSITANGSAMNLNEIDIVASTKDTTLNEVTKAAKLFKLKYTLNGQVNTATVNFASGLSGSTARMLKFGDTTTTNSAIYTANSLNGGGSLMIPVGQTMAFEVLADVLPISSLVQAGTGVSGVSCGTSAAGTSVLCSTILDSGDVLKANLPSAFLRNGTVVAAAVTASTSDAALTTGADGSNTTCALATAACWSVLDQNGNAINNSSVNRQGSANGYEATFRVQGISANYVGNTFTPTKNTSGVLTSENYLTTITVSAVGGDYFINPIANFVNNAALSSTQDGAANTAFGFNVAVLNSSNQYVTTTEVTNASAALSVTCTVGCVQQSISSMKIPANSTATFVISTTLTDSTSILAGGYKVAIFSTNATDGTTLSAFPNTPSYSFITPVSPDVFQ